MNTHQAVLAKHQTCTWTHRNLGDTLYCSGLRGCVLKLGKWGSEQRNEKINQQDEVAPRADSSPTEEAQEKESTGSWAILGILHFDFLTPLTSCTILKCLFSERFVLVFQKSLAGTGAMWSSTSVGQDAGNKAQDASYCAKDTDVNGPPLQGVTRLLGRWISIQHQVP